MLAARIPVVLVRFAWREAQVRPLGSAECLRDVDDLADMIGDMRKRPMQRFVDFERLLTDCHRAMQPIVVELGERSKQRRPAVLPLGEKLALRDCTRFEFLLAMPPWLFAVAGEEFREA